MDFTIKINAAQVERLFTFHGFEIVEKDSIEYTHVHGSTFNEQPVKQRFIKNPMSGDLVLVNDAFNKLIKRYVQGILFGIDKSEVIFSLME